MARWRAIVEVVVEFDAEDEVDAKATALKIEDGLTIKTPPGRDAEIVDMDSRVRPPA